MFAPIEPRESAVAACARALRNAILGGEIAPGERLPPERELAERFQASRATVRGALADLAGKRLLSVRQGSGYVVRDFRHEAGPDLLPDLGALAGARGEIAPLARDLLLVRRHLAAAVLEAIAAAEDTDVAPVEAAVRRFAEVVASGAAVPEIAAADVAVVAALLDATGSPVLQLCHNPIVAVLRDLPALRDAIYREPAGNVAGYEALLAWLPSRRRDLVPLIVAELERRDAATLAALAPPRKRAARPRRER